jgi:hypothetical protein
VKRFGNYTQSSSSSSSSSRHIPQSSSSSNRVEIPPKTRYKKKTKHIMKISHINVNIYDKTVTSQQNRD